MLLGQALDARTETSELLNRVPGELASEWLRLLPQLDRPEAAVFTSSEPGGANDPTAEDPLTGEDRHALAERWERLVEAIRRVPGCEDFLRLPRTEEMLAGIGDTGPVVVVNVSPLRCDALVLHRGRVRPVRLEGLRHAEAERRADAFLAAIRATGDHTLPLSAQRDAQAEVRETLGWLWTALAEPVLDALMRLGMARGGFRGRTGPPVVGSHGPAHRTAPARGRTATRRTGTVCSTARSAPTPRPSTVSCAPGGARPNARPRSGPSPPPR